MSTPVAVADVPRARRQALLALIGVCAAAFVLRPQLVGVAPLLPRIQDDLGISHGVAGLLSTIPVLCMGLTPVPVTRLARRHGAALCALAALLLIGVAGLARAASGPIVLILALTVPVGIGIGAGNVLLTGLAKQHFADRPLFVTGMYTTSIQIGAAASAAGAVPLATGLGSWRDSLLVFSVVALAAAAVFGVALRPRPARAVLAKGETRPPAPVIEPARRRAVTVITVAFFAQTICYYGLGAWLPDALEEHGWSSGWAAASIVVLNVVGIFGTLGVARYGDRRARRGLMVTSASLITIGILGVVIVPDVSLLWTAVAGLGVGALFAILMGLPLDLSRSPDETAHVAGRMLGIGYTLGALAPFLLGAIRDWTGSFSASMWSLVVPALVLLTACTVYRGAGGD